jgi:hypothetical protein
MRRNQIMPTAQHFNLAAERRLPELHSPEHRSSTTSSNLILFWKKAAPRRLRVSVYLIAGLVIVGLVLWGINSIR